MVAWDYFYKTCVHSVCSADYRNDAACTWVSTPQKIIAKHSFFFLLLDIVSGDGNGVS